MLRKRKSKEEYFEICPICERMKNGNIPTKELKKVFHRKGKHGLLTEEELPEEEEEEE